jgi:alanine-synthesizing transaminase
MMKSEKSIRSSARLKSIEYAIRDVVAVAQKLESNGKSVTYLSIGDPPKYFPTPRHIKDALIQAVNDDQNYYFDSLGLPELREAIAEKENKINKIPITMDDVLITEGVSEGILFVQSALINANKKDELLIPGPSYPPWLSFTNFYEGNPIEYQLDEENNWQPNIDDLRQKISEHTRGILLLSPNNPTGVIYSEKQLKAIADLAGEYQIPVISDDIYDRYTYDKKFISIASVAKDIPVIGLNGFSKTYLMTGWRLGYLFYHDPEHYLDEIREDINRLARIRLCASSPAQIAGVAALRGPQDHIKKVMQQLRERRDYTCKRLNEIENIECKVPEGAFYAFPKIDLGNRWKDDKEFIIELLNSKQVLFVYGSGFGPKYGSGHFRVVYLAPIPILEHAFDKLADFMKH